jgi:Domain of unknown function (DUF5655)/Domain of unknown function (DUF4287)
MPDKVDAAMETFVKNFEEKYGKLDKWVKTARKHGGKHGELVKFLKTEHGMTHGYANYLALQALKDDTQQAVVDADPVAAIYAGPKAGLLPLHKAVEAAVNKLGSDVEFSPKKAYISLRRKKQFGCIMPASTSRVELGLVLKGVEPGGRLEASTNEMFTHRIKVETAKDVDKELTGWLKKAYDAAG